MSKKKANPNYIHLKKRVPKDRVTLLQGGTRSGKTYSCIYYFIDLLMNHRGIELDIVRDTYTALKATVWKDFVEVLQLHGLYDVNNHNKTDKIYLLNGNTINYYGCDDHGKIHGRKRDILWINEGQTFDEEIIDQLFPRTKYRIVIDYNPAIGDEHWLDPYIDKFPPLKTTYLDNPHLTKEQVGDIEMNRSKPYWWTVYGTGERTKMEGAIFEDWKLGEFDLSLPHIYGMDFGYVQDPTALIKVSVDNSQKKLYGKELIYKVGMNTGDIVKALSDSGVEKNELIIADCAEPRLISEIRDEGFNIFGCTKGPDSVRIGLVNMSGYQMIIEDSPNLKTELSKYVWHDKKSNTPIDKFNHLIDAWRYGFDDLTNRGDFFIG